jgi:predicted nucleic acid-binding protein
LITFVDTNVLVYARDVSESEKQSQAAAWMNALWASGHGRTSMQVLGEYYVTVTRKLSPGLDPSVAKSDVLDLLAWEPALIDANTVLTAWTIEERFGLSWWDSLVVASATHSGCGRLLSEDLRDGQDLDGVLVVNPFRTAP